MKRLNFQLDGLLSGCWPILGLFAKVPISLGLPPNVWTAIRFFGAIWVILCFKVNPILGALCFAVCLYTDALDGLMARSQPSDYAQRPLIYLDPFFWIYSFDWISKETYDNIGKWFDPLADKVFIIPCFYYFGLFTMPLITPVLFYSVVAVELGSRFFIIPIVRIWMMKKPLYVKANKLGKAKFIIESSVGVAIMLCYLVNWPWLVGTANFLMFVAIFFSIGSMLGHLWPERFIKMKLLIP